MLDVECTRSSSQWVTTPEQRRLLAALEGYANALTRHGLPMPYRMRSELAMYRAMSIPKRRS
jgi:hypothetical protein